MKIILLLHVTLGLISGVSSAVFRVNNVTLNAQTSSMSPQNIEVKAVRSYISSSLYTIQTLENGTFKLPVMVITDQDGDSFNNVTMWYSTAMKGSLTFNKSFNTYYINWSEKKNFTSSLAFKNRGLELSELQQFDGNLLTVDDKTGVVFKIRHSSLVPWLIESDGNGESPNYFKAEWMTVKNELLYIGSQGYEYVSKNGSVLSTDNMWIKVVSRFGETTSVNWHDEYVKVRESVGIFFPGYIIHEAVQWSEIHQKWFFLPRKVSTSLYNISENQNKGSNYMIIVNDSFTDFQTVYVGDIEPTRGFSAFQFIPGTDDTIIIALKTEEFLNGEKATYTLIFSIDGTVYYNEQLSNNLKFEGLVFSD